MRDAWRLVEPVVLARAAARALVCALVGGAFGGLAAVVLGLAGGVTPIVERAALLRDLDAPAGVAPASTGLRPAWETCLTVGALVVVTWLQLLLLQGGAGAGIGAQTRALADLLASPSRWSLVSAGALAAALVAASSADVVLARLERRTGDPARAALWALEAATLVGLLFAGGLLLESSVRHGLAWPDLGAIVGGLFVSFGVFFGVQVGALTLLALDGAADMAATALGAAPSAVESPATGPPR